SLYSLLYPREGSTRCCPRIPLHEYAPSAPEWPAREQVGPAHQPLAKHVLPDRSAAPSGLARFQSALQAVGAGHSLVAAPALRAGSGDGLSVPGGRAAEYRSLSGVRV